MTVNTTTNRKEYACNGVTTAFSFPYYFLEDADLVVLLVETATGTETTLTLNTDYTLTGAGDPAGGTVTTTSAYASAYQLVVYRDPTLTQGTALVENDPLPAAEVEKGYDRLTMINQRDRELLQRSLRLPEGDTGFTAADMQMPAKVNRASKYLGFDASGKPVAQAGTSETPAVLTQVDDIASLRNATPAVGERLYVKYHTSEGDAGGGVFRAATGAATSTYTDNNGTTIVPTGGDGSAAWLRVYSGAVEAVWFGFSTSATGAENLTALTSAVTTACATGGSNRVILPGGTYRLNQVDWDTMDVTEGFILEGASPKVTSSAVSGTILESAAEATPSFTGTLPYGCELRNFTIDGNGTATRFRFYSNNGSIVRVNGRGHTEYDVVMDSLNTTMDRCRWDTSVEGAIAAGLVTWNANTVRSSYFNGHAIGYSLHVQTAAASGGELLALQLDSVTCEEGAGADIYFDGSMHVVITNLYCETSYAVDGGLHFNGNAGANIYTVEWRGGRIDAGDAKCAHIDDVGVRSVFNISGVSATRQILVTHSQALVAAGVLEWYALPNLNIQGNSFTAGASKGAAFVNLNDEYAVDEIEVRRTTELSDGAYGYPYLRLGTFTTTTDAATATEAFKFAVPGDGGTTDAFGVTCRAKIRWRPNLGSAYGKTANYYEVVAMTENDGTIRMAQAAPVTLEPWYEDPSITFVANSTDEYTAIQLTGKLELTGDDRNIWLLDIELLGAK